MKHTILILLLVLLFPVSSAAWEFTPLAQVVANIRNPSAVAFEPSPDHATIEGYDLDILRADGSVFQTVNIGKPTCALECTASMNVQPAPFGTNYTVRLRARAVGAFSDWAMASNRFDRVPGGPSKVIIRTTQTVK